MTTPIPCPFVYAKGKRCTGHVVEVRVFKADVSWSLNKNTGEWEGPHIGQLRSHCHLYCSEKGNHAGFDRPDSEQMKFFPDQLPEELFKLI